MIAAAEFNSSGKIINAMYSNLALHGAPVSINLITNAILKSLVGDEFSISATNNPPILDSSKQFSETEVAIVFMILFPKGKQNKKIYNFSYRIPLKHKQNVCNEIKSHLHFFMFNNASCCFNNMWFLF